MNIEVALAEGTRAQYADGDLRASRDSFERAYQLAERDGDSRAMALAAVGLAGLWVRERRTVTDAAQLAARLQHVLPRLDQRSPLALRVRARLAGEADYTRGEHAAILAVLDEVRKAADPVALAETLSIAHHCVLGPDHPALRRDLAAELTRASFRTERRGDFLMGLLWQTVDSYLEGDPHAGRLLAELRDHLKQGNHLAVGFVASAIEVMLTIRAGRFGEAESLAKACASNGAEAGDPDSEWWYGAQLLTIRWYQGRLGELLPMLRGRADSAVLSDVDNSAVAALAVAAAVAGDRRTAASSLAALRGHGLTRLPRGSTWLVTMHGVVEAAHLLDDTQAAAEAYDLLLPYAALPMIGSLGVTCFGSVRQALGVAALTAGRLDQAIDHLHAAVQHNLGLGHWPAVLASRRHLARAYAGRGGPGDAEAAARQRAAAAREGAEHEGAEHEGAAHHVAAPGTAHAECARAGRQWRITAGNRTALVADSIGMLHLAVLIANPRREIRAADLVAGLASLAGAPGDAAVPHHVLDREAISEYTNRLKQLGAEIESAGDEDQAARARAERDWITAQLAGAAGFAGRVRSFPDQGERARVAVGKAIRRALAHIAEADPVVGEHLRQTVHTGMRCSYWPS